MQTKNLTHLKSSSKRKRLLQNVFRVANGVAPSTEELSLLESACGDAQTISELLTISRGLSKGEPRNRYNPYRRNADGKPKNILILSTFPFDAPRHGGQHRLHHIVAAYRSAGHHVHVAGVLGSDAYPATPGFVRFPGRQVLTGWLANSWLMEDWAIGSLFEHDDGWYNQLQDQISIVPDVIHVELPWLFGFAQRYRSVAKIPPPVIVYGSQNIEHKLKYSILFAYYGEVRARQGSRLIYECERRAILQSDVVSCVSEEEFQWITKEVPSEMRPCIIAPNGASPLTVTDQGLRAANSITGHHKFALLCASGHPPNIHGFWHYFGNGIGCLAPDERLMIAGSLGHAIVDDPRFKRAPGLHHRCVLANEVAQDCLDAMVSLAHTIVLPITYGSGTNLKSAEAILSAKHVVATSISMRGFESYHQLAGMRIADHVSEFLSSIRKTMESAPLQIDAADRVKREGVLWSNSLNTVAKFFANS